MALSKWLRRNVFVLMAGVLMMGAVAVAAVLLRPVLSISPSDKNAVPALAAAIAVSGVLTTAGVTLTVAVLKQSIDLRTARLAEEAAGRAVVDQQRLLMETALQTVQLIGGEGDSAVVRGSAALIVLARLGELRLAVDLAQELWPDEKISSSAAVQLAQDGLASADLDTQYASAMLLRNNTEHLYVSATQYEWPQNLDSWPTHLPTTVRHLIAITFSEWLQVRPPNGSDWRLNVVIQGLALEQDVDVKNTLATISQASAGTPPSPLLGQ